MLLIHVQQLTPRVMYSFKQVCKRILGLDVDFTSKIEAFIAHDGPKFSYGKQPLGKELYFQSVDLLFEHGITTSTIRVFNWDDTKCFFKVNHENSALPFDIFAASFYLLTRYEEYLPHVKDELGRYNPKESIAFVNEFLREPVVDIWAYRLKEVLLEKYPDLVFEKRSFSIQPVIKVSKTFVYLRIGILRSIWGSMKDLWSLEFSMVSDRFKVLMGFKKDPYDTFDFIIKLQKERPRDAVVFFGLGDFSNYEKNVNHNNPVHRRKIKHVADYMRVGLRVSFEAILNKDQLKTEVRRLEHISNRHVEHAQCAFYKIALPKAYRNFIDLEIQEDFSMGYRDYMGFRAGTCTPFLFYDLDYEVQTPLLVHPFCFTNRSFENLKNEHQIKESLVVMMEKVKKVNGKFIPVFSNSLFSAMHGKPFWKSILQFIWNLEDER